ncbi:MAG: hypothetical protein CUN56_01540 [Phototrophicales bacterium]|nr:MAG: hypothetical protein CUN56_01540 [Phototrophicales bacterium]RMG70346.1 MAG: hypothetical protein D6711_17485 [Chloroflexota bacterium]
MIRQRLDKRNALRWVGFGWLVSFMLSALLITHFLPSIVSVGLLVFLAAVAAWAWRAFQSPGETFYVWVAFISQVLGGVTAGLFIIASLYFTASQTLEWQGMDWVYTGGLVGGAALLLRWIQTAPPLKQPQSVPLTHYRIRWVPLMIGTVLLMITAEINGNLFDPTFLRKITSHMQFVLLVVGMICVTIGMAGKRVSPMSISTPRGWHWQRDELLMVLLIFIVAISTRLYQLGTAQRFWIDEVHFSNPILYLAGNPYIELLTPFSNVAAFPYVFPYMQWHMVKLFGHDLTGLRMISALIGAAGVLALYLLSRELFGKRVGGISAALLAAFPVHIQFSRIGLNNIVDPLLGTLVCYFIVRAWKNPERARVYFAWAGVCLGLTQYFYEGGRFLFPTLTACWLIAAGVWVHMRVGERLVRAIWRDDATLLRHHLRANYQRFLQSSTVMIIVAILIAAPIYYMLIARHYSLGSRMESAGMNTGVTQYFDDPFDLVTHIFRRVNESFLIHVTIPEAQLYYGGDHPFLLPFLTPFFLLGGVYCFWMLTLGFLRRDAKAELEGLGALLLVIWVLLTWFGNALLQESRISARYVVSFPAISLLVALGIHWILDNIWQGMARMQNYVAMMLVVALVIPQIWFYFGPHMVRFNQQFRDSRGRNLDVDDALFRSRDFPAGTMIHIVDSPAWYETDVNNMMRYLSPQAIKDVRTLEPVEFHSAYLNALPLTIDHAFYIAPDDQLDIRLLQRRFPHIQGPFYTDFEASKEKGFALYYLPATEIAGG